MGTGNESEESKGLPGRGTRICDQTRPPSQKNTTEDDESGGEEGQRRFCPGAIRLNRRGKGRDDTNGTGMGSVPTEMDRHFGRRTQMGDGSGISTVGGLAPNCWTNHKWRNGKCRRKGTSTLGRAQMGDGNGIGADGGLAPLCWVDRCPAHPELCRKSLMPPATRAETDLGGNAGIH